jgi:hypothetical protein
MNRKICWSVLAVIFIAGLTACGGGTKKVAPTETIVATSGSGQSATVGTAFAAQLVATVMTGTTPDSGVVVTFAAPATGASGTFAGGANTATTNANGVAMSAVFTANGTAGAYSVTATAAGASAPASFSLTNNAGAAAGLKATVGATQSAAIDTAFGSALGAQVVDSNGNPVSDPGVSVQFAAPASSQLLVSGTFDSGGLTDTVTTNANGLATSSTFTANGIVGSYAVIASSSLNSSAVVTCNFNLTNLSAAPVIVVASGSGQSTVISTAFGAPLVATVTTAGVPTSGVVVTFTPPATGASVTFAGGVNTATTDMNGNATSTAITADGTAGGPYTVAATAPGAAAPANFTLTNTAATATTENFVFYLNGAESNNYNFLSLAGAVTINMTTGAVTGGVQDYDDANGITSPQPDGDTITGGQLTVNSSTGQGTLTLITSNALVGGVNTTFGTEELGVQFVNANHALIIQFDGSATSSGSMDFQTLADTSSPPSGPFAFTLSGIDTDYDPIALGGVLSFSGNGLTGTFDVNDDGTVVTGDPLNATVTTPKSFGRGTITGSGLAVTVNYYIVGPKAIRIIDVDSDETGVGSAFSQSSVTFTNALLPSPSVFAIAGNAYAGGGEVGGTDALGQFTTSNTSSATADFSGVGDDNELGNSLAPVLRALISGTYSLSDTINGYGSLSVTSANLGSVTSLGIYMTDQTVNLNDPNNSTGGGGALVLDLDDILAGTTGVLIPQVPFVAADFTGDYAVGMQNFNSFSEGCTVCEFDLVGQASVNDTLIGSGLVSDPFITLGSTATISGVAFSGTPLEDTSNHGRYTLSQFNSPSNELLFYGGFLDMVVYQASGGQLFWLETDDNGVLLGPLEQQGSLTGIPAAKGAVATTQPKLKQ